ncbi:hypothetical protein GYMLUDRAFT_225144 [Collybiopsis luxurians FD-317 M1]|uniref:Methyltransferase domain-containing protein n=1 Tax=Collybiopsis luxurians FD-317 M1 TaxID=944289 RepID=A0A0D0CQV1_9AGAR|nr:hypothetical protein GYMLUDRAFT_225144 [Collybiopsis luxurians FD-317 M1]
MDEHNRQRYYTSEQYLLPADEDETARLNSQHRVYYKLFGNRLSLAPLELKSGDRVLESAAGTGIWALEFFEENKKNGVILDMDCVDISDKQFTKNCPSNVHLSLRSVTDLPAEWKSRFSYAHQRLMVSSVDHSVWPKVVSELFRVISPGGWVEIAEVQLKSYDLDVGPFSKKLQSLILKMFADNGSVLDVAAFIPPLLEETGFVDVRSEVRQAFTGRTGENGYRVEERGSLFRALKRNVMRAGGYGVVKTEEEYEELVRGSELEWYDHPNETSVLLYTFWAKKP